MCTFDWHQGRWPWMTLNWKTAYFPFFGVNILQTLCTVCVSSAFLCCSNEYYCSTVTRCADIGCWSSIIHASWSVAVSANHVSFLWLATTHVCRLHCQYVCLSVWLSVRLSACLCVCLSLCLSVCYSRTKHVLCTWCLWEYSPNGMWGGTAVEIKFGAFYPYIWWQQFY